MNIEQKVNLHNRFDIEVIDGTTGKVKQKAEAHNIILDQMYTRLCGGSSYFVNIHFGTGTGTPVVSRTSLFTHLGTKVAVNEELIKAIPASSWKRKIVLNPEEFVGSTITEVGIAYGSTASNLVTHAMLKDSEGNPISITKTDTDVITIYATVFVTFAEMAGITYLGMPSSNALVNYLIGGSASPAGSFGLSEIRIPHKRLGSTANVTWTSDTVNKQRKTNVARFGISTGNGHAKVLDFTNVFDLMLPTAGIFSGQPYEAVPIGTGDGSRTRWTLPSCYIRQSTIVVKSNGVVTSNYSKEERNVYPVKTYTQTLLGSSGNGVALTPDGSVMAVAHQAYPYVSTYDWIGSEWVKRPDPATVPTGTGYGVALTPDGLIMAVAHNTSPGIMTYDWIDNTWVKRPDPATVPRVSANGVALTPDGLIMAVAHITSPYITTYDWIDGAWVKRPNPDTLPPYDANGVALTPDGLIMAVAHTTSPGIMTYDWTDNTWVKRPDPATLPTGYVQDVALTPDGLIMALAHGGSPYVSTYDWIGSEWVKRPDPATVPTGTGYGVALTPDGLIMAVAHRYSPYVMTYDWIDNTWVKRPDPATLPPTTANGAALTSDGLVVAIAHDAYPNNVATYLNIPTTDIVFNQPPALGDVLTADYTVDGVHKTDQYIIDVSFSIQFGEGV